jgi:hypothetical protein
MQKAYPKLFTRKITRIQGKNRMNRNKNEQKKTKKGENGRTLTVEIIMHDLQKPGNPLNSDKNYSARFSASTLELTCPCHISPLFQWVILC